MKIAIIHDSFLHFGGAERVLFSLIEIFPKADVYTSLIKENFAKDIEKKSKSELFFSKLSHLPFIEKYASFLKPYFFHYFWKHLDLDEYDLVISSSHSFCAHFIKVKNKHISYIHTTPRFLHEELNQNYWIRKKPFSFFLKPYFSYLKKLNKQKLAQVDLLISNSKNVKNRLKKYYKADSRVIYPPTKNLDHQIKNKKNDSYLFFSRLVKQKGIDLVIDAFNKNGKNLIVIGTGKNQNTWHKKAKKNIKFLGFVNDKKVGKILNQSKALIYASIEEDFGLVPVEAMFCGLPVITYKSGGVKETIINEKTGLFFEKYNQKSLNQAIENFEKMKFKKSDCINQARKFSENQFKKNIKKSIREISG